MKFCQILAELHKNVTDHNWTWNSDGNMKYSVMCDGEASSHYREIDGDGSDIKDLEVFYIVMHWAYKSGLIGKNDGAYNIKDGVRRMSNE